VALFLIDQAKVNAYSASIKFGRTVKISSLKNENFKVYTDAATPAQVTAPFEIINTIKDYNQISRIISLYWKAILVDGQSYFIRIENIVDSAGSIVPYETVKFTYISSATPSDKEFVDPGTIPVLIEDRSVKTEVDISYNIIAKNPLFYIENIDPVDGDFYLSNDYNYGRVTVTFNEKPASNFLNNRYFLCQRKKIQKGPSRWENITTSVSTHSWRAEVYIDFPSLDATPSYFTADKDYFEQGYKYRIKISKDIGI
jgi:hypothetical protein